MSIEKKQRGKSIRKLQETSIVELQDCASKELSKFDRTYFDKWHPALVVGRRASASHSADFPRNPNSFRYKSPNKVLRPLPDLTSPRRRSLPFSFGPFQRCTTNQSNSRALKLPCIEIDPPPPPRPALLSPHSPPAIFSL